MSHRFDSCLRNTYMNTKEPIPSFYSSRLLLMLEEPGTGHFHQVMLEKEQFHAVLGLLDSIFHSTGDQPHNIYFTLEKGDKLILGDTFLGMNNHKI